jgi:Rrf2 family protein
MRDDPDHEGRDLRMTGFRVSSRSEYGLRAMVYLAAQETGRAVPLREIAAAEEIPASFLERILAQLRTGGLVRTVRGPSGGYLLARRPADIPVGDVVTAVEGPLAVSECLSSGGGCDRAGGCASRLAWRRLEDAVAQALDGLSLDELLEAAGT